MSAYATLLEELAQEEQTLAKALKSGDDDDKDIHAMADGDEDDDGVDDEEDSDNDGDEEPMGKSLKVTLANGQTLDAYDGTVLVKSLQDDFAKLRNDNGEVLGQLVGLVKALSTELRSQRKEIGMHKSQIARLSASGSGRRSQVADPLGRRAPEAEVDAKADLLAKAQRAFDAGKLDGIEYRKLELSLQQGASIDQALIVKALAA